MSHLGYMVAVASVKIHLPLASNQAQPLLIWWRRDLGLGASKNKRALIGSFKRKIPSRREVLQPEGWCATTPDSVSAKFWLTTLKTQWSIFTGPQPQIPSSPYQQGLGLVRGYTCPETAMFSSRSQTLFPRTKEWKIVGFSKTKTCITLYTADYLLRPEWPTYAFMRSVSGEMFLSNNHIFPSTKWPSRKGFLL